MNFFESLASTIWFFFTIFAFVVYLMAMFSVIGDIFRDHKLAGGFKALWILALIFIPLLTVLAYLIFRGKGMAERQLAARGAAEDQAAAYVKHLAGTGAADEIAKANELLKSKAITQAEFDALKARALA